MFGEMAIVKPRRWIRVPTDILSDARLVEVSGMARTLFAALYPGAAADPEQRITGSPAPAVGWLLAPNGQPASNARLAKITGLDVDQLIAALSELRTTGAIALADSGAWGLVGWASGSPAAARLRKYRAAKTATTARAPRRGRAAA